MRRSIKDNRQVVASTTYEDMDTTFINKLISKVNNRLEDSDNLSTWTWQSQESSLQLLTVDDETVKEYTIPYSDLSNQTNNIAEDVDYILKAIYKEEKEAKDVKLSKKANRRHQILASSRGRRFTVKASEEMFADPNCVLGGDPDDKYSMEDLNIIWNSTHNDDPCMMDYSSFEDWWADTRQWLVPIHASVNIRSRRKVAASYDMYEDDDNYMYDWEQDYEEIASKQVEDSDGFLTDYTMYRNLSTGEYVFVFGDRDIYSPMDGWFDFECDTAEEAWSWFDTYTGLADDDDIYSATAVGPYGPYGLKDVKKWLSGELDFYGDEIEMDHGDGEKLAQYLTTKGKKVKYDDIDEAWYIDNDCHWTSAYFYPYPKALDDVESSTSIMGLTWDTLPHEQFGDDLTPMFTDCYYSVIDAGYTDDGKVIVTLNHRADDIEAAAQVLESILEANGMHIIDWNVNGSNVFVFDWIDDYSYESMKDDDYLYGSSDMDADNERNVVIPKYAYDEFYRDSMGGFGGTEDDVYSLGQIMEMWNSENKYDPVLVEYDDFDDWWADTKRWMKRDYHYHPEDVEASLIPGKKRKESTADRLKAYRDKVDRVGNQFDELQRKTLEKYGSYVKQSSDVFSTTAIKANRDDNYFGEIAAFNFGNQIVNSLGVGATVSKRTDLAEMPGGLIYEANKLGIDMWDLLEALEGLCADGRAAEIDPSTYQIISTKRHPVRSLFYNELEDANSRWADVTSASTIADNGQEVFQLMYYSSDPEAGIDGDDFYCYGAFFANDRADADRQLNEAKQEYPAFFVSSSPYSDIYIEEYNDHFATGDEIYPDVSAIVQNFDTPEWAEDANSREGTIQSNDMLPFDNSVRANYYYITKHGLGPGTLPKDVEINYITDMDNGLTSFYLDRFLTTSELNQYDIYPETHDIYKQYPDWIRQAQNVDEDGMYDEWQKGNVGRFDTNAATNIDSENFLDRLYDVAEKYNTSKPVSGDWETESADQANTIANEFGISVDEAVDIMVDQLGFDRDEVLESLSKYNSPVNSSDMLDDIEVPCPYCTQPTKKSLVTKYGMCWDCYDNNVE